MLLTPKELTAALKDGTGLNVAFLLSGEEEYLKAHARASIRKAVLGEDGDFGYEKLAGEGDFGDWFAELQGKIFELGMFCPQKVIEVHSVNYNKMKEGDRDSLLSLLGELPEGVTVILYLLEEELDFGTDKKPSAIAAALYASPVRVVRYPRETPASLCKWVVRHFAAEKIFCPDLLARSLIDYCSADMFTLAGEIEKLSFYLLQNGVDRVSEESIRLVCRPERLVGAFDFSDAILRGDTTEAMRLLAGMKKRKEAPELILGGISECIGGMFNCKLLSDGGKDEKEIAAILGLHAYRVTIYLRAAKRYRPAALKAALDACVRTDIRSKQSAGADRYLAIELLILELRGRRS